MNTLVMIPALGCNRQLYSEMAKHLDDTIRMQTIVATKDRFADCVAEILAAAPERFTILGTSFGGRVAMELAVAAPERLSGLVVIGSGAGPVADQALGLRRGQRMRGGEFEQVLQEMGNIIAHMPGPRGIATMEAFRAMARSTGAETMAQQSDALAYRADLWPDLTRITCPVLCLWGAHDQYVAASEGLRLAQSFKAGRYAEIGDCGHFPTLEYPEETATAIGHWLRDHGLTSG